MTDIFILIFICSKQLGQWLKSQRKALNGKRGKMTEERKRLLEEHLPEWFNKKSKSASSQKSSSSKST
jgi:hypothetical protein